MQKLVMSCVGGGVLVLAVNKVLLAGGRVWPSDLPN